MALDAIDRSRPAAKPTVVNNGKRRRLTKDAAKAERTTGYDFASTLANLRRSQLGFSGRSEARASGRRGKERFVRGVGFFR